MIFVILLLSCTVLLSKYFFSESEMLGNTFQELKMEEQYRNLHFETYK